MPAAARSSIRQGGPASTSAKPRQSAINRALRDASDEEVEEEEPIVKGELDKKYLNQPVRPEVAEKRIRQLAGQWRVLEKSLVEGIETMAAVASELEECNEDDEDEEMKAAIASLDVEVRVILDKLAECQIRQSELAAMTARWRAGEEINNAFAEYDNNIKAKAAEYHAKTSRAKYAESQPYADYRAAIWRAKHDAAPVPHVKGQIPREDGDSSDEEIEIAAATVSTRDPITMAEMRDPVMNANCKHRCERMSITEMITTNTRQGQPTVCPHQGCSAKWTLQSMSSDEKLKRDIEQAAARKKRPNATQRTAQAVDLDSDEDD